VKHELLTYQLTEYRDEVLDIPSNDILANIQVSKSVKISSDEVAFSLESNAVLQKIYRESIQYRKESGTETLCLSEGILNWEMKQHALQTPLILYPIKASYSKITHTFSVEFEPTVFEVNPYLSYTLKEKYDLVFPDIEPEEQGHVYLQRLLEFLHKNRFTETNQSRYLANFHPHRFSILKDLDQLIKSEFFSPLLHSLLGEPLHEAAGEIALEKHNLFPSDLSQEAVFEQFEIENCVVQGPPGTGKSQVLSNLLGRLLAGGYKTLVVSEKAVALKILIQKLKQFQLDTFAFVAHPAMKSSDFIEHVKASWKFLEIQEVNRTNYVFKTKSLIQEIQQLLDRLNNVELTGGIRIREINKKIVKTDYDLDNQRDYLIAFSQLEKNKSDIDTIYKNSEICCILNHIQHIQFQNTTFTNTEVLHLHNESKYFINLFSFNTLDSLENWLKKAAICQFISHPLFSLYESIYGDDNKTKLFIKTKLTYSKTKQDFEVKIREKNSWKLEPSLSLAEEWKSLLAAKLSWIKKRKLIREIDRFLSISTNKHEELVENWIAYLQAETILNKTKQKLLALGIEYPENEIPQLEMLDFQFSKIPTSDWQTVKNYDPAFQQQLQQEQTRLQQFIQRCKSTFRNTENLDVPSFCERLKKHANLLQHLQEVFQRIPVEIYRIVATASSFEELEQQILFAHLERVKVLFPSLAEHTGEKLQTRLNHLIEAQNSDAQAFAQNCIQARAKIFGDYHQLMQETPGKLSAEKKALRTTLKRGKAILVREFAKSKSHLSIRELMESDSRLWIELLCPVFLSTPSEVAEVFPLQQELFDCLVIDEASQIPVSHALGALQRAKRAIIAGDEQQMAPNFYFSSKQERVAILHQASYHWKKVALRYHYRCEHPALISFSNKHFYNNSLYTFPAYPPNRNAQNLHFIPNGIFENRVNSEEAKALIATLIPALASNKRIGIVAFSESQLAEIQKQIPFEWIEKIEELQERDLLFFKSLEHIQGDECDILFISLGYGKDPCGNFQLRFGPLNRKNGSRRLNVLLSRAKSQIHFFTSVRSSDFAISSNEAIDLLRKHLYSLENQSIDPTELRFPFDFRPTMENEILTIEDAEMHFTDAHNLLTVYHVLKNRGWKIRFS
jgi:hypothetical protein